MSPSNKSKGSKSRKKNKPIENREVSIVESLKKLNGDKYNSTMLMSGTLVEDIPKRSSGVLSNDIIIGGGYPFGRIIEIFGREGSGKTTLTLHGIEAVQRTGGVGMFIDAEHALNLVYAKDIGVDVSKLILHQPSCGEEALNLIEDASSLMAPGDIIVVDSVAALTPQAEIDGEMGDQHIGLHARLMSQAMRKLAGNLSRSGVIVIFINQIRDKIGVVFGSNKTTTGGNALKFYAYQRIEATRIGNVKKNKDIIGVGLKLECVKNKVYPPFKKAETILRYGKGIPRAVDVLTIGMLIGMVERDGGSNIMYKGERLGQGIDNAAENITMDEVDELEQKILDCYKIKRD